MKATSVRLDEALLKKIDGMAELLERPRSWVIAEALRSYVEREDWFREAVAEGLKDADEGKVIPHGAVRDWVESWGNAGEKRQPNK